MAARKIDLVKLRILHGKGLSHGAMAKQLGVDRSNVTRHLKKLGLAAVRNVVVEQAPKGVAKSLNAIDQLCHINKVALHILDELTGEEQTTNHMVQAVKAVLDYEKKPTKDKLTELKSLILRINQEKNTAIKACAEVRAQVGLQLEIFQALYDIKVVAEYHQELIKLLKETSPKLRDEFLKRLDERQAIRRAIKLS
jgi:DNA-binding MarR family transcriptional regulator